MGSGSVTLGAGVAAGDSTVRVVGRAGRAGGASSPSNTFGGFLWLVLLRRGEVLEGDEGH